MSARTFHRFSELSCELRHLIWEASCFNRQKKRHGMHYVDCHGWRNYHTRIECRAASESEISACLKDAGLWAACRESRRVIQRRMRQHGFLDTDEENRSLCLKGSEPATLIIDELKDIVCFRFSDWYDDHGWTDRFHFYLSYADSTEEFFPRKVAFEIDGIWDHEHRFWIKMLNAISSYNSDDHDWYPLLNISIFDKNIHWFRDHSTLDDTYADSDNEFAVVQWRNLCRCNQRGTWCSALAFLMHINWRYRRPYDGIIYFLQSASILVRRDNEVVTCQSCQTQAQAQNGWYTDHLLDDMDVATDEEDEKVEESNGEEQEPETE
ncbi:hypothetical protein LB507_009287 [Fusarium sp. FIESC RH6]|nr:hypothetical protein LB507_009287 [Fusarium sp. FIESC RH6]